MEGNNDDIDLSLATEGSATDDFDVDAILNSRPPNTVSATKQSIKVKNDKMISSSNTMNNVSNNVSLHSKSVLDADDDYNDNSISPTGMKNGKKITGGKVKLKLIVSNFLRLFCVFTFSLFYFSFLHFLLLILYLFTSNFKTIYVYICMLCMSSYTSSVILLNSSNSILFVLNLSSFSHIPVFFFYPFIFSFSTRSALLSFALFHSPTSTHTLLFFVHYSY
jgi:hypothetical protein